MRRGCAAIRAPVWVLQGDTHGLIYFHRWRGRIVRDVFPGRHGREFAAQMDSLAGAPWRSHPLVTHLDLFCGLVRYVIRGQFL